MRLAGVVLFALLPSCALLYDFGGEGGSAGTTSTTSGVGPGSTGAGQGATCDRDAACVSGHCVDGVCCDTTCDGPCQRCSASGACEPLQQGTECAPGTCNGGRLDLPSKCSPGGACIAGMSVNCLLGCAGTVCAGCTPGDCGPGEYCPPEGGTCVAKLPQGMECTIDDACASGHCTDGRCCSTACLSTCEKCGVDGVCVGYSEGEDPEAECPDEPGCGRNGACSGKSACQLEPETTACSEPTCVSNTFTPQSHCDGMGTCPVAGPVQCEGGYACEDNGMACRITCTVSAHCATGLVCIGGNCVPPGPQGSPCANGGECANGTCVDNYCCNTACGAACQACSNVLTGQPNGTCSPVLGVVADPLCPTTPEVQCDGNGMCAGGTCQSWAAGTPCGDPSCSGSNVITPTCDGSGLCVLGQFDCNQDVPGDVCCTPPGGEAMCGNPTGPFCD